MIKELECGCEIDADFAGYGANSDMANYKNWRVNYCPKHTAAPDMYEALQLVITWDNRTEDHIPWWKIMRQIEAALELADRE